MNTMRPGTSAVDAANDVVRRADAHHQVMRLVADMHQTDGSIYDGYNHCLVMQLASRSGIRYVSGDALSLVGTRYGDSPEVWQVLQFAWADSVAHDFPIRPLGRWSHRRRHRAELRRVRRFAETLFLNHPS